MFKLGKLLLTHEINNKIADNKNFCKDVFNAIKRYSIGDWGEMPDDDLLLNDEAVKYSNDRIFAAYNTVRGEIWIITEADRSYTTILFPHEY